MRNAIVPGICSVCREKVEVGNEILLDVEGEPLHAEHVPIRLCCLERHGGVVCRDNRVMCQICFERFDIADLFVDPVTGDTYDVCKGCEPSTGPRVR